MLHIVEQSYGLGFCYYCLCCCSGWLSFDENMHYVYKLMILNTGTMIMMIKNVLLFKSKVMNVIVVVVRMRTVPAAKMKMIKKHKLVICCVHYIDLMTDSRAVYFSVGVAGNGVHDLACAQAVAGPVHSSRMFWMYPPV